MRRRVLAHPAVRAMGGRMLRFLSGVQRDEAVSLWVGWAVARSRASRARTGLVRGPGIVWPLPGRAWVIGRDLPLPGAGEVLIRTAATAVSPGTERAYFMRLPNAIAQFPIFPGYSAAGEVVAVGPGVSRVRPGDTVAASASHGSLALVREDLAYPVPAGVRVEEAAFVQLGIIAMQAWRRAQWVPGEPVAVIGHGIIGQFLVQIATGAGAYPVISLARTGKRLTTGLRDAATRILLLDEGGQDLEAVDAAVTLDATGHPDGIVLALACTRAGGRIVLAGSPRGRTSTMDFGLLAEKGVTVRGTHIRSVADSGSIPRRGSVAQDASAFLGLLACSRMNVASLISDRIHPLEAERFYRRLCEEQNATVGAIFCWDRLADSRRCRRVSFLTKPDVTPVKKASLTRAPMPLRPQAGRKARMQ